ncbi:hypothetical protein [Acaryochloris marina]|uniref:hypothetical protein n=1 Tax=Acaryochloris marina TaxID=155978 RepID=UPI00059F7358|nr:hypothetical protein [Acaryochloris marina]
MYPLLAPGFDSPKIKLSSRLTPQPITIKNGSKQGSYTFGALPIFFSVPNAGRFSNSHFFLSPIARSDKSGQYKIFEQWRLCQLRNPKFDYFGQNHFLDENDFVVLGTILDTQNQIDCIPKIQKQIDYYFVF